MVVCFLINLFLIHPKQYTKDIIRKIKAIGDKGKTKKVVEEVGMFKLGSNSRVAV